jgi:hypothetical protein
MANAQFSQFVNTPQVGLTTGNVELSFNNGAVPQNTYEQARLS